MAAHFTGWDIGSARCSSSFFLLAAESTKSEHSVVVPRSWKQENGMPDMTLPLVGVVGCGYWGKNLVRNFFELGALAAVCDVSKVNLDAMRKSFAVKATPDFDELVAMPEIRGIVIAAPAAQHHQLAKKALLAGKDVLVEKPLALKLQEGEELVKLANQLKRVLMVGHLLHYHPALIELHRMLHAGELGKIEYISS